MQTSFSYIGNPCTGMMIYLHCSAFLNECSDKLIDVVTKPYFLPYPDLRRFHPWIKSCGLVT